MYVWIEYVKSELNIGDDPSRICELLKEKKCKIPMLNIGVPNSFYETIHSQEAFNAARFGVESLTRGVRESWTCV